MSAATTRPIISKEKMYQTILSPLVTEKATALTEQSQVVFKVRIEATKPEIKAAVEFMFKTQVKSVSVVNVRGKEKRFGRFMGKRNSWKKAYVALQTGQEINFADGEVK